MEKFTVRLKMTRPGRHSTTPLSARSSYENENRARSSRVMGVPDVAETMRALTQLVSRSQTRVWLRETIHSSHHCY